MPLYCYVCRDCDHSFEVWHSMNFDEQECTSCDSSEVHRVPSLGNTNVNISSSPHRPGKIVNEYIEEVRQEIKKEKKEMKSREL